MKHFAVNAFIQQLKEYFLEAMKKIVWGVQRLQRKEINTVLMS